MRASTSFVSLIIVALWLSAVSDLQAQSMHPEAPNQQAAYSSLEYRLLGPFRGGRSAAVTGVPGEPDLYYMGSTGGGVWRTENGGTTWENISDGYFGGSIGAVKVAPSDHNIIYVGGGEKTVRGNVSSGYGMWKSMNAGKTWERAGLPSSRHISRLVIHPTDPNTVWAAVMGNIYKPTTDRGVYKTTDGGKTWKKTLYSNDLAGAVDLIMDPNNPRTLYATTWRLQRTPYSLSSGGEGSKIWKSTDSGNTWTDLSNKPGFATGTLGIMGVTVSPAQRDRVWAIVESKDKGGVYRSDDGGETWSKTNSDRGLRQRAWYYSRIYADSQDPDRVYVVNVNYHRSDDGGRTFKGARAPHGDHHDLWIAPEDNKRMIMGDDGGAQISYNGGNSWSTYNNQPTAQFYRVTTDNAFPYRIYAAQQDNSTVRIPYRTTGRSIDQDDWESTAGGESAHIAIDPKDNDIVYGGSYGGFLTRVNHKNDTQRAINVWPDNPMGYGAEGMKYRFQWNFPILFSQHDKNKLYAFSNHVHATTNEGQSWELLSQDLTRNDPERLKSSGGPITQDNTGVEYYCTIFAASESPVQPGVLWTGSDDGLIHVTRDDGKTWSNVTPKRLPEWAQINSIEASKHNAGTAYIAATRYKSGDFAPYLYKTTDFGKSWTSINSGIPGEYFTRVVREDATQPGLLYAGTETGVFISKNDGKSWMPLQLNLPIVPITDLHVKGDNLIVATQGRSLWVLDDLGTLRSGLKADLKKVSLYKPQDAYRYPGNGRSGSLTSGTNLAAGVTTQFYLPELNEKSDVRLTYLERDGDTIASYGTQDKKKPLKIKTGANSHNWDTRYQGATRLKGMILWWAGLQGPKAVPGQFEVRLNVNGTDHSQTFNILPNPTGEADSADMRKQFEFMTAVNETVERAHQSIKGIRDVNKQLDAFVAQYGDREETKELVEQAKEMKERFGSIEKELYQTQNRSGQDPLNFPIRLTNKLAHLNSLVGMGDFPPTVQDEAVRQEMTQKINEQLAQFDAMLSTEVAAFNNQFNQLGLNYLNVKKTD